MPTLYLLTTAYADNLHEMGLDDTVQAVLWSGDVYPTLHSAQEAAQAQLTEMTDDVDAEHTSAEAFAWEHDAEAGTWKGTSTCLDALVRAVTL